MSEARLRGRLAEGAEPADGRATRIFVVGCPRSGTTLVQSILAAHPRITSFPESHFFNFYATSSVVERLKRLRHVELRREMATYFERMGAEKWSDAFVRWHVRRGTYAEMFVDALDHLTGRRGATVWVEKTPSHLERIETIESFAADARFVHVVRRGTDVVASLHEVTHEHPGIWGGARTIDECIDRWMRSIRLTERYADRRNHEVVVYGGLTERPEDGAHRLAEFAGVDYDPNMLEDYGDQADRIVKDREDWKEKNSGPIRPRRNSRFQRRFDAPARRYIRDRISGLETRWPIVNGD